MPASSGYRFSVAKSKRLHTSPKLHPWIQRSCPRAPPCPSGMVEYKMRKSRGKCCRSSFHAHKGPSRIGSSPWLKFLHRNGGKGYSRKQLKSLYRKRK